jgi:hypothetical protein
MIHISADGFGLFGRKISGFVVCIELGQFIKPGLKELEPD